MTLPYGYSHRPKKRTRFTFDTEAKRTLEALLGHAVQPVITASRVQTYLDELTTITDKMWDETEGRLSARQQQQVRIIKRTQGWLLRVIRDLP